LNKNDPKLKKYRKTSILHIFIGTKKDKSINQKNAFELCKGLLTDFIFIAFDEEADWILDRERI
jgi:hypothetical protein